MAQKSWSPIFKRKKKEKNRKDDIDNLHGILVSHTSTLEDRVPELKPPESNANNCSKQGRYVSTTSIKSHDSGFGDIQPDLQDCDPSTSVLNTVDSTNPPQLSQFFIPGEDEDSPEDCYSNSQPEAEHSVCEALPLGQLKQLTSKSSSPRLESICEEPVKYSVKCEKDRRHSLSVPLPVSHLE